MKRTSVTAFLLGWAVLAVPAIFWIYVLWTYHFAARHDHLPVQEFPLWLWFVVYFALLGSGVWAISRVQMPRMWMRIGLAIVYVTAMAFALLITSFSASCTSGDCL